MDNYKFKLIVFILLIITLIIGLYYSIFGYSISYLTEEEIKETRKQADDLINSFTINNIDTIYDINNDIYFYSIPIENENKKYILNLDLPEEYKYKIINAKANLITVEYDKVYDLLIFNDKYYDEIKIKFTNLPLISIVSDTEITEGDTNSMFTYINPSNLDKIITYNSKIHIRGDTSKRYDKKSYKLEIFKSDYEEEKNINISNFYYGSSFILDAAFRDYSKIRNVLAIDIWNNFSDDFDNIDVYSEFVEVFINGEYKGLYVFTEPINRRKLNLNKTSNTDTSVVFKTISFKYPTLDKNYNNIIGDSYLGYELKYPNEETLFKEIWNKFLNKMATYYSYKENITYNELEKIFDVTNYIDIILFNSFTNNNDNQMKKNNYFYMKSINDVIHIQPWDMEFSFGTIYSYEDKYNFKEIDDSGEITFNINHINSKKINQLLIDRYWNLRKTILNKQYFDAKLDKYLSLLNKGAALRDSDLYVEYEIEKEINKVRDWLYKRIDVYDNYIRGLSDE